MKPQRRPVARTILALVGIIAMIPHPALQTSTSFIEDLTAKEFDNFINSSNVRIVFFFARNSQRIQAFIAEYEKSAKHLDSYGIKLGKVNCQVQPVNKFCLSNRIEHHAFGFREGKEKIALPLDTLFDVDSIVSSALHLSLIHIVPIIQTYNERKQLEKKYKGKMDILFTHQSALGTYEHRVFLESAFSFLDSYIFAMTTSESATQGLRKFYQDNDQSINYGHLSWPENETSIWVLHTSEGQVQEPVDVTNYIGDVDLPALQQFINDLRLPVCMDLNDGNHVLSSFERLYGLACVFYDDDWRESAEESCQKLGKGLRGMVGVVTVHVNNVTREQLSAFGVLDSTIIVPCIAFRAKWQAKAILMKGHAGAEQFIVDNLYRQRKGPSVLHAAADPVNELVELQQDDSVAQLVKQSKDSLAMATFEIPFLTRESFKNLQTLPGKVKVILFYVQWDPVSQTTVQIVANVQKVLMSEKVEVTIARVDCFDWPDVCDGENITTYPTLRLIGEDIMDYNGILRQTEILFAIYTQLTSNPVILNEDNIDAFLEYQYFPGYIDSAIEFLVIAAFQDEDKAWNEEIMAAIQLRKQVLIGRCFGRVANYVAQKFHITHSSFLIVSKRNDAFEKVATLPLDPDVTSEQIIQFVQEKSINIFGQITPANFALYDKENLPLAIYFALNPPTTEQWTAIGSAAADMNVNQVRFGWMDTLDSATQNILQSYMESGICSRNQPNLIVLNRKNAIGSMYEFPNNTEIEKMAVIKWVLSILDGHQQPTGILAKNDWKPLHPGFDYLRLLDEEMERELDYSFETGRSFHLETQADGSDGFRSSLPYETNNIAGDMDSSADNSHTEL